LIVTRIALLPGDRRWPYFALSDWLDSGAWLAEPLPEGVPLAPVRPRRIQ
jgi:hypothetical protein